jgi:hypothetical protein
VRRRFSAYRPVFEELNGRKAIVFVHPATAACCRSLPPDVAPIIAEVPQDTPRAIANLLLTGTFSTFPDFHFIFAHAGNRADGGGSHPTVRGENAFRTGSQRTRIRARASLLRHRRYGVPTNKALLREELFFVGI